MSVSTSPFFIALEGTKTESENIETPVIDIVIEILDQEQVHIIE